MMRGASGDECGNLVLGQEYNRPAEAGVLKEPRGSDFLTFYSSTQRQIPANIKYLNHCIENFKFRTMTIDSLDEKSVLCSDK
jgi:hypothetical protein